jgi:hypothetical protein
MKLPKLGSRLQRVMIVSVVAIIAINFQALFSAALLLGAAIFNTGSQYQSAAEFEAVVQSWRLTGKSRNEAIAIFRSKDFYCEPLICYQELQGFPCNQKLQVTLVVNSLDQVTHSIVRKLPDGRLPTVCL